MAGDTSDANSGGESEQARELLRANVDRWSSYHSQKENMTWAAATLYVAAVAIMLGLGPNPFWASAHALKFWVFFVLLVLTGAIGLYFIYRQFRRRHAAHILVHASANLLARWLVQPPKATDLEPVDLGKHGFGREADFQLVPAAVINEVEDLKRKIGERDARRCRPLRWLRLHDEALTYWLTGLWSLAALAKLFLGWQTARVWLAARGLLL